MQKFTVIWRIAIGLMMVTLCILFTAHSLRISPDVGESLRKERASRCEAIAVYVSQMVTQGNLTQIESSLQAIAARDEDLLSLAVARDQSSPLIDIGDHQVAKQLDENDPSEAATLYQVPIVSGSREWGSVEVRFRPVTRGGVSGFLANPFVKLCGFVALTGLCANFLFMRRTLSYLDPSKVVPVRVRAALDSLTNSVMLLNNEERIAFANRAFSETVQKDLESLTGLSARELPWEVDAEDEDEDQRLPWTRSIEDKKPYQGTRLALQTGEPEPKYFLVNAAPIFDESGKSRGAMASFDDVTNLEKKKQELVAMLQVMRNSRDEIREQNQQLELLATQDPLTACLNRRSFFERFEALWASARRHNHPLGCIMFDLDHFKSINDNFGHATGDEVLKKTSALIKASVREEDLVCRYGGEEFCILVPHLDVDDVAKAAERYRQILEATKFDHGTVTASIGVSGISLGASDPHGMLEQADKCLYVAKRQGRNQVVRWDAVPDDVEIDESAISRTAEVQHEDESLVPFHAVTALISALAFRDLTSAQHSRRVADLCSIASDGVMTGRECYLLEVAALLHDIGKIGIPDDILNKEGPLDEAEWKLMRSLDDISVEIVRASFGSKRLVEILEWHRRIRNTRSSEQYASPPVAAQILVIADAYDAMVSDRVYRAALDHESTIAELTKLVGIQFDAEVLERFSYLVSSRTVREQVHASATVSKETALQIGMEMEGLVTALDREDIKSIHSLAQRLMDTADRNGVQEISEMAARLAEVASDSPDLLRIVELTGDLLTLCRTTQKAFIDNRELAGAGR